MEVEALIEDWRPTSGTRLVVDADKMARDPKLALVGCPLGGRMSRRLFPPSGEQPPGHPSSSDVPWEEG